MGVILEEGGRGPCGLRPCLLVWVVVAHQIAVEDRVHWQRLVAVVGVKGDPDPAVADQPAELLAGLLGGGGVGLLVIGCGAGLRNASQCDV